jgi:peptidoglycan/xylan/chitin deacetylase (PgdA/CDA1 family)
MLNVLSVDNEAWVDRSPWGGLPSRVGDQIQRILDLFEEKRVKATFFVLDWIAENSPHVIQSIASVGHEIGCHSDCGVCCDLD